MSIPALTEERRKELVKVAKKMSENTRVSMRNHRRKTNEDLKNLKNNKELSEDDLYKAQEEVQKITDEHIKKCDELAHKKEKEILEF